MDSTIALFRWYEVLHAYLKYGNRLWKEPFCYRDNYEDYILNGPIPEEVSGPLSILYYPGQEVWFIKNAIDNCTPGVLQDLLKTVKDENSKDYHNSFTLYKALREHKSPLLRSNNSPFNKNLVKIAGQNEESLFQGFFLTCTKDLKIEDYYNSCEMIKEYGSWLILLYSCMQKIFHIHGLIISRFPIRLGKIRELFKDFQVDPIVCSPEYARDYIFKQNLRCLYNYSPLYPSFPLIPTVKMIIETNSKKNYNPILLSSYTPKYYLNDLGFESPPEGYRYFRRTYKNAKEDYLKENNLYKKNFIYNLNPNKIINLKGKEPLEIAKILWEFKEIYGELGIGYDDGENGLNELNELNRPVLIGSQGPLSSLTFYKYYIIIDKEIIEKRQDITTAILTYEENNIII